MTPFKHNGPFLCVILTLKPLQLLWTGLRQLYRMLQKGQGFCLSQLRLPDRRPIVACLSDFSLLPLRPMVVQTVPLTTHPLLQSKREGPGPWYNGFGGSENQSFMLRGELLFWRLSCWPRKSDGSPHSSALSCPSGLFS